MENLPEVDTSSGENAIDEGEPTKCDIVQMMARENRCVDEVHVRFGELVHHLDRTPL